MQTTNNLFSFFSSRRSIQQKSSVAFVVAAAASQIIKSAYPLTFVPGAKQRNISTQSSTGAFRLPPKKCNTRHHNVFMPSCQMSTGRCENRGERTELEEGMTLDALAICNAAIRQADPALAVNSHLSYSEGGEAVNLLDSSTGKTHSYKINDFDEIMIFAFGKASVSMAATTADILRPSQLRMKGVVITKDGHGKQEELESLAGIQVEYASHPIPDARCITAAKDLISIISRANNRTLIINCISGGGSALFCSPREGLSLKDMEETNNQLLASGMPITDINVIRKRLEVGKGGGLAGLSYPATSLTMVLSDVIGDPLDLIASGPTVADESTFEDAWNLVLKYRLDSEFTLPETVLDLLQRGRAGLLDNDDSPDRDHPVFTTGSPSSITNSFLSETVLVGNNLLAVQAAANEARCRGYNPIVLSAKIEGEARHISHAYISMAEQLQYQRTNPKLSICPISELPAALIAGGETTVTLSQDCGKGGRNQEIGLAASLKMHSTGLRNIVLASVGTDGTDGPTDAAGAVVDGGTIDRVEIQNNGNMLGESALANHDAYNFFSGSKEELKPLIKTGPTGSNVADVCVTLIK